MRRWLFLAFVAISTEGCDDPVAVTDESWQWELPPGFPVPVVPDDNPMSAAKVELGRRLFYDVRLSANGTQSCGSCHAQELAFTDGFETPVGSEGAVLRRNSMSLTNVAYNSRQTWANSTLHTLEQQALVPIFGEFPIELGATGHEDEILARLADDPEYPALFAQSFPDDPDPVRFSNVARAISAFERTLISGDSPFDRYNAGDRDALSDSAQRGMQLFYSERLECFHCHGGFNFALAVSHQGNPSGEIGFHNTGLYDVDGSGAYPLRDQGLIEVTSAASDMGRFRAPTLRNIGVTAPYMHDGSIATLDDVLRLHYERGGRLTAEGSDAGDGAESPLRSIFVNGFILNDTERVDLIAFLNALTDESFLSNEALSDPFVTP
jgi:cytochrome c peroxidase